MNRSGQSENLGNYLQPCFFQHHPLQTTQQQLCRHQRSCASMVFSANVEASQLSVSPIHVSSPIHNRLQALLTSGFSWVNAPTVRNSRLAVGLMIARGGRYCRCIVMNVFGSRALIIQEPVMCQFRAQERNNLTELMLVSSPDSREQCFKERRTTGRLQSRPARDHLNDPLTAARNFASHHRLKVEAPGQKIPGVGRFKNKLPLEIDCKAGKDG